MEKFIKSIENKIDKKQFIALFKRLARYSEEGKYQKVFKNINFYSTCLIVVMMGVVFSYIQRSTSEIQKGLENNVVYVYDTIFVQPPKIYYCWTCNKELIGVGFNKPVTCCGFEYKVQHGELIAKKID